MQCSYELRIITVFSNVPSSQWTLDKEENESVSLHVHGNIPETEKHLVISRTELQP